MSYHYAHAEVYYTNVEGSPRVKILSPVMIDGLTKEEAFKKILSLCPEYVRQSHTEINALFSNQMWEWT